MPKLTSNMFLFPRHAVWRSVTQRIAALLCTTAATLGFIIFLHAPHTRADNPGLLPQPCFRPEAGSAIEQPPDLRSHDGLLRVNLAIRNQVQPDGSVRYCYVTPDGRQAPTLRLKPGDLLVLQFSNEIAGAEPALANAKSGATSLLTAQASIAAPICRLPRLPELCARDVMTPLSSNLHFHGLTVPPVCHQDDVLRTALQPGDAPFEYRLRIPADEPPGLYWYHPHIHGVTSGQMLGGASGALIIEGIEQANPALAGLAERVLVIRDQNLLNPDAPPSKSEPVIPKNLVDSDGDAANNGTGFGKPAKDLSVNFVPVPYPDYPPATLRMKPNERQLWRVLNASSVTYLNLALLFHHAPQPLGVVAIDGVPITISGSDATPVQWTGHIGIPPGSRVEFIVTGPHAGEPALLVTRTVDTGPGGENDPNRALASIVADPAAPEEQTRLPANGGPAAAPTRPWIGTVTPSRVRKFYLSEKLSDPNDPASAIAFYITEEGKAPQEFDPESDRPDVVVRSGDVEDWIIENRSKELHDFHVHQLHFQVVEWNGLPVNEPFLRDTVNVPYYNGRTLQYPSVRVRMDFRDPSVTGTFVYHCHLLEHEDRGMMGRIKVEPAGLASTTAAFTPQSKGNP